MIERQITSRRQADLVDRRQRPGSSKRQVGIGSGYVAEVGGGAVVAQRMACTMA